MQRFVQIQTCLRIKIVCSALIYYKLLMQKGICASVDQVTRVHLLTSCASRSWSVHLNFETSFSQFTAFHDTHTHTQLPTNKAQCNSLMCTRFEKFANVRYYTETNAFQLVSAELRIALMCSV